MKTLLLFLGCLLPIFVFAEEKKIVLITGKDAEQVFFIDCAKLHIDTTSMLLTSSDGVVVPFSLDWRYDLPPDADRHQASSGTHVSKSDGFASKWYAPSLENRFAQLGWLSFCKHPGVNQYILTFRTGNSSFARCNPDAQAWWIELMLDPQLLNVKQLHSKQPLTPISGGGVEFTTSFFWPKSFFKADSRLKGRRLLALTRLSGNGMNIVFNVPFHNKMSNDRPVLSCYAVTDAENNASIDNLIEGRVDDSADDLSMLPQSGIYVLKTQPEKRGRVFFFHLQAPPEYAGIELKLNSALFNLGDEVKISAAGFGEELLYTISPGIARVDTWEAEYSILAELEDESGQIVKAFSSESFRLVNVPTGNCRLVVTLRSSRSPSENIASRIFPVEIQDGPSWK